MEDKEVGEQWRNHYGLKYHGSAPLICMLIRKLVEERANSYAQHPLGKQQALRDFGIDPATWTAA